jgi:hypothetical protein
MARECLWIRISKGGVLEQTDEVLRDRTTYRQRLEELKAHGNLLGLASDTGAVRSESDRHHAAVEGHARGRSPRPARPADTTPSTSRAHPCQDTA